MFHMRHLSCLMVAMAPLWVRYAIILNFVTAEDQPVSTYQMKENDGKFDIWNINNDIQHHFQDSHIVQYNLNDLSLDFFNNSINHPRMCVWSALCSNVDKYSPFDIYSRPFDCIYD